MPTFETIYTQHADLYDRLIRREDHAGNLPRALAAIAPFDGADVVEFGAGTGRLTRLIAPAARRYLSADLSHHMLLAARESLRALKIDGQNLVVAHNARMPLPAGEADIAIEGWSFGHIDYLPPSQWRAPLEAAVSEMMRVLKPGGMAVIIETLGTGRADPQPPAPHLGEIYAHLESEHGFMHRWVRTDYAFADLDEAVALAGFFFGDEMAQAITANNWLILPECTGIWYRRA